VKTFQIAGQPRFEEGALVIPDEDVRIVMEQTCTPEDIARNALIETKGDLAAAILRLSQP
jgi:nascent polypeptide-associated complex subunit alpha